MYRVKELSQPMKGLADVRERALTIWPLPLVIAEARGFHHAFEMRQTRKGEAVFHELSTRLDFNEQLVQISAQSSEATIC